MKRLRQGDKLGPYELNSIATGDAALLLADLPEACIDLTVTSPPYDNLRDYKGYTFDFEPIATELFRVTKPGGVVVWVVGDATVNGSETGTSFRQALGFMGLGFRLHDTMIYEKAGFRFPDERRYNPVWDYMFIFSKGQPKSFNPIADKRNIYAGTKVARRSQTRNKDGSLTENSAWRLNRDKRVKEYGKRNNIWRIKVGGGSSSSDKGVFKHPAIFPEALAHDHIMSWSNPGDVVLDPMCGSGTVPKMCVLTGRQYIAFDISKEYCELARERVATAESQPVLFNSYAVQPSCGNSDKGKSGFQVHLPLAQTEILKRDHPEDGKAARPQVAQLRLLGGVLQVGAVTGGADQPAALCDMSEKAKRKSSESHMGQVP